MTPEETLRALASRYPLPPGTTLLEPYVDVVDVGGLAMHAVGLGVEHDGETITGSAAQASFAPVQRAYMELLERLAIVTTAPVEEAASPVVDSGWRAARSNGVAIERTAAAAARRATWELVERDRVLRSWYGELTPEGLERVPGAPEVLADEYDFQGCLLEPVLGVHAAAVFAFPRHGAPLAYGFAARAGAADAIAASLDECLQRLTFLWGEALPAEAPLPAPSPSFHQEHFLYPPHHDTLRRWLAGEHARFRGQLVVSPVLATPEVVVIEPGWLSPELHVARALPRGHVPLGFGRKHPLVRGTLPDSMAVHPIV